MILFSPMFTGRCVPFNETRARSKLAGFVGHNIHLLITIAKPLIKDLPLDLTVKRSFPLVLLASVTIGGHPMLGLKGITKTVFRRSAHKYEFFSDSL